MTQHLYQLLVEHAFLLNNGVIWALFITAFISYGLLIDLAFLSTTGEGWYMKTRYWVPSIRQMLAALPLLGLLGTIHGLLTTFLRMSRDNGFDFQEVLTGGIAEAMFTTQVGLFLVIPGLLMLALLNRRRNAWETKSCHEIHY